MSYQTKRLKQQRFWRRARKYIIFFTLILLVFAFLYLMFRSEFFLVQDLEIHGLEEAQISQEDFLNRLRPLILNTRSGSLFGAQHYLGWKEGYEPYVLEDLHSIVVEKDFFARRISIHIIPQDQFLIWCTQKSTERGGIEKCYWVNKNGQAFASAPSPEGQLVPVVRESQLSALALGQPVIDAQRWEYIQAIDASLKNFDIGLREATLFRDFDELHVISVDGIEIDFSLRFDPRTSALGALTKLYSRVEPGGKINLTIENRAFYQ